MKNWSARKNHIEQLVQGSPFPDEEGNVQKKHGVHEVTEHAAGEASAAAAQPTHSSLELFAQGNTFNLTSALTRRETAMP